MEVIHAIIAGLDVHLRWVVATVRTQKGSTVGRERRRFETTTPGLLELLVWLEANECPIAVIESTGVYWKPVFNILEGSIDVMLVNAAHAKAVSGYKSDRLDADRLADLGAHGLLRPSFIPPAAIRELRELTRYRKSLVEDRTREINRAGKLLESANIKISAVVSDIFGASGRAMMKALVAGQRDPLELAQLARGSLRGKIEHLIPALTGRFLDTHRIVLGAILDHVEYLEAKIEAISEEVDRHCDPFREVIDRVITAPGIGRVTAEVIVSEIGIDMSRFPTEDNLASWAGMCPGNNETAGKRHSGRMRKGNPWLRSALFEAAWAASHTKGSDLQALFRRFAFARGKGTKKAIAIVAHQLLITIWHMINDGVPYQSGLSIYPRPVDPEQRRERLVKQLERLGFQVTLHEKKAA